MKNMFWLMFMLCSVAGLLFFMQGKPQAGYQAVLMSLVYYIASKVATLDE